MFRNYNYHAGRGWWERSPRTSGGPGFGNHCYRWHADWQSHHLDEIQSAQTVWYHLTSPLPVANISDAHFQALLSLMWTCVGGSIWPPVPWHHCLPILMVRHWLYKVTRRSNEDKRHKLKTRGKRQQWQETVTQWSLYLPISSSCCLWASHMVPSQPWTKGARWHMLAPQML